jgi:hypothetical protein
MVMIKLAVIINNGNTELTMEGEGNKSELMQCIGVLEDLKYKILTSTQEDGSSMVFSIKKEKKEKNNGRD